MNCVRTLIVYCLLALALGFSASIYSQQNLASVPTPHKVLVLFDSNTLSPWKRQFSDNLHARLLEIEDETTADPVQLSYEFLGLDDLPADIPDWVLDGLRNKQQLSPADVVVSVLQESSGFLYRYGEDIYPDAKFLYVSPSELIETNVEEGPEDLVLPGASTVAIENTITLIPQLLPELQYLTVISGTTAADDRYWATSQAFLQQLPDTIQVSHMTGISPLEMRQSVSSLPQNSAILLLSYQDGIDSTRGRLRLVIEAANSPVFTVFDPSFIEGVVGGNYTSSELYGRITADMAQDMLSAIPPGYEISMPTRYRFNQPQLRRWGIDENLLPVGSSIENREASLVEFYGNQLLILLAVVSVLMFFLISSRRQATDLGEQKNLFESVINSIPDAILLTDAETNIFATNLGALKVFGYTRKELLAMKFANLVDDPAAEEKSTTNANGYILGSASPKVVKLLKKGQDGFFGEVMTQEIVSAEGKTLGFVGLIRDVSKRLSLEEEQRQGQKMEALGNLVGGISHDFNNVLGVISGYAQLLELTNKSAESGKHLDQILQATERAKSLIAQIMSFSGDNSSTQETIELPELLEQTMSLVKVSIPSNISIETKIDEDVQSILGSAVQIEQIILNLTTNAYQAMKSGNGNITISLEGKDLADELILSHGILDPGNYTVLTVEDNGPGMIRPVRDRVFEPFFSTKKAGEGSGMGLAIVYNIVKAHGATLDLKSAPGKGTKFTVYFHAAEDEHTALQHEESAVIAPGKGERILLVDDEKELLAATQQLLSNIGYQVEAFSDPLEALEAFREDPERFDLLVSDQAMPGRTGIQLLGAIREINPEMQAMICTGYSEVLGEHEVQRLNLGALVRKPYSLAEISQSMRNVLGRKQAGAITV